MLQKIAADYQGKTIDNIILQRQGLTKLLNKKQYRSMDKKEKLINSHIGKAIGYSDKAHYELQTALHIALEGKGLSDQEKELLSVDFATGPEEAVERVADGSCNDEYTSAWDSSIRDCRISEVYRMTGEQIREYFNL